MNRLSKTEQQVISDLIDSRIEYHKDSNDIIDQEEHRKIAGNKKTDEYIKDGKARIKQLRVIKKKLGYNNQKG